MCSWFNNKIKKIAEQYPIDSSSPMGSDAVSATVQLQIYAQPIGCPNFFCNYYLLLAKASSHFFSNTILMLF
jgi:hypothetical protein